MEDKHPKHFAVGYADGVLQGYVNRLIKNDFLQNAFCKPPIDDEGAKEAYLKGFQKAVNS